MAYGISKCCTMSFQCLVPFLDLPTAARVRAVSKTWKATVDMAVSASDFTTYASNNTIMIFFVINDNVHKEYVTCADLSQETQESIARKIVKRRPDMIERFRAGFLLFRGLTPMPYAPSRWLEPGDPIIRGMYCVLFRDDVSYPRIHSWKSI